MTGSSTQSLAITTCHQSGVCVLCCEEGRCPCLYTNPLTWAAVDGEVGSVPRVFTTYGEGEGEGGRGTAHG